MTQHTPIDPVVNFIELMGLQFQGDGAPRIAGRIYGLLLMEGRPLGLQDMATRLQVSRASISTNARLLATKGLVELVSQPGDRQDYYQLIPVPHVSILETVSARMASAAERMTQAEAMLPEEMGEAKTRVRALVSFYRQSADFMQRWVREVSS
ncbi:transcriptional regulator [Arsenicitalea aurantiaca]|uniref:Transcriptional regulator n=1 Tax=Arsenicitalea aurantiaca TaxID=1783274 RepID=A0A433XL87_9HYPH|nr:MarR family transcriptional regulator [Arsenicitalea aurantiaca]RUT34846.1 transcriptional regulator [Arsenicitalea aurantiaca]